MVCRLFYVKPLPEPMLTYFQLAQMIKFSNGYTPYGNASPQPSGQRDNEARYRGIYMVVSK